MDSLTAASSLRTSTTAADRLPPSSCLLRLDTWFEYIRFPLLPAHFLEVSMNKDQVVGNLKQAAGKIQEKAGELIDSPTQQAKGLAKQAEGTAQ